MQPCLSSTAPATAAASNLFTERGEGEKLFYYEAPDDYAEASFVVDTIAQLVASQQFEPGECAVMYRTNAQSRLLEEAFLQARLPYRLVGAQRFYGRREVKDMIAYLRLAYNANDEASLTRIINVPTRGIGAKTITALYTAARAIGITPGAMTPRPGTRFQLALLGTVQQPRRYLARGFRRHARKLESRRPDLTPSQNFSTASPPTSATRNISTMAAKKAPSVGRT